MGFELMSVDLADGAMVSQQLSRAPPPPPPPTWSLTEFLFSS